MEKYPNVFQWSGMKNFRIQFNECAREGYHADGEFLEFKNHPELLPAYPNEKMQTDIENGVWKGIQTTACLRFGGMCFSGNKECKKLRGVE